MPTYEYECENGHRFEVFQSMKDEPLSQCTQCGAKAKRLIGPGAGFLFRGGGFYSTDNRSKDYKQKAKAESSAADSPKTDAAKPDAPKGESKPKAGGSGKDSGSGKPGGSGSST
jgi:putative FmdB family regulatory protein